jgi:hypothetical protein
MTKIQLTEEVLGFTHRDSHSKAILNTDTTGLLKYKIQKQNAIRDKQRNNDIVMLKEEFHNLKNDLQCIKEMLLKITK